MVSLKADNSAGNLVCNSVVATAAMKVMIAVALLADKLENMMAPKKVADMAERSVE